METIKGQKNCSPEKVLDGSSMEQDIFLLIGYVHQHGVRTGERGTFDSEHMKALGEEWLRKYLPLDGLSPKSQLNTAHLMKSASHALEQTEIRLQDASSKLRVHEHYMSVIQRIDSRCDTIGRDNSLVWDLRYAADNMEKRATEALKTPETFDDIEDNWTAKGNGASSTLAGAAN